MKDFISELTWFDIGLFAVGVFSYIWLYLGENYKFMLAISALLYLTQLLNNTTIRRQRRTIDKIFDTTKKQGDLNQDLVEQNLKLMCLLESYRRDAEKKAT